MMQSLITTLLLFVISLITNFITL